ncbi:acetylglutamate kinase [Poriferisphaera sp. WC338]|uniref:acetylglutamate kinase n=1 Tax=Poriferisphaera sp. WC338 TaxID=3425129 RepID=UPI003D8186BB
MTEAVSQEAITKAAALVEAQEYIHQFAGKTIVVKVGGSIMDQPEDLRAVINDVCFMASVGMRPIIVHGGGKGITAAMQQAGLEAQFVQGRRYTDERTLAIAEHVLTQDINIEIQNMIRDRNLDPMGLHSLSSCAVFAKRLFLDGEDGRKIDIGFVGEVEGINNELLNALTQADVIPVIAPIARDKAGGKLNVNADSVAGHVAAAVHAEKLILISDTHGIRTSDAEDDLARHLTKTEIEKLVDTGIITQGMLPKVESSFIALAGGVRKAHIIDGRIKHAALLEVYTDTGIGTEIVL